LYWSEHNLAFIHSIILVAWHPSGQTVARLSKYWPKFLQVIILLWLLYLGCTTNHRIIPFGYLHLLLIQKHDIIFSPPFPYIFFSFPFVSFFFFGGWGVSQSLISTRDAKGSGACGSGIIIAEEFDVEGRKGSGDNTMVDIETFLEVFAGLPDLGIFF
jgi:hypothetical protein